MPQACRAGPGAIGFAATSEAARLVSVSKAISPLGRPTLPMTSSQASMQRPQPMHSSCWPSRMSMPVGQTATHALQSTQSPRPSQLAPFLCLPRGSPRQSR